MLCIEFGFAMAAASVVQMEAFVQSQNPSTRDMSVCPLLSSSNAKAICKQGNGASVTVLTRMLPRLDHSCTQIYTVNLY